MERPRPFSDTQEFVQKAYEEMYRGERPVSYRQLSRDKAYSWILKDEEKHYYQAEFQGDGEDDTSFTPLTHLGVREKPFQNTPLGPRRQNSTLLYAFDPDIIFSDIEREYAFSHPVRFDVTTTLQNISDHVSDSLKQEFPLPELTVKKPYSVQRQIRVSQQKAGSTMEIYHAWKDGATTQDLIQQYGQNKVMNARRQLGKWGLEGPERIIPDIDYDAIVEKLHNPETSVAEKCLLIQQFRTVRWVERYSEGDHPVFMTIINLQQYVWANKDTRQTRHAYNELVKAGEPVSSIPFSITTKNGKKYKVHYSFLLADRKNEAAEILEKANISERKRPVTIAYGPPVDSLPNTYTLYGSGEQNYINVQQVLKSCGIFMGTTSEELQRKLRTSPISILGCKKGLFLSVGDRDQFVDHMLSKNG